MPDEPGRAWSSEGLDAASAIISETRGFLGIADLAQLVDEDRPDLKFPPFDPRFPERIREHGGDCFAAIQDKDILVHHPYESFEVVVAFIQQAAADPDVVAIKQTLYRAGKQSAIINALIDAAEAGKSVTAVVELKARFDEEQNLMWANALERAGVQVVYGFIDWKTHAKVSMVVRREEKGYRTYCHFGTGNYHPVTARIYTDLSYFTADPQARPRCRQAVQLHHRLSRAAEPQAAGRSRRTACAPSCITLIDAEIASGQGRQAVGRLGEDEFAGRPGRSSTSSTRRARPGCRSTSSSAASAACGPASRACARTSTSSRSSAASSSMRRLWCFANGDELPHPEAKVYISSADWMPRNFDRRIEYMLPIENPTVHAQLLDQVMVANLIDNEQSWRLNADGTYTRLAAQGQGDAFNLHHYFMTNPSLSGRGPGAQEGPQGTEAALPSRPVER